MNKKIVIRDADIKSIIIDIADQLDHEFERDNNEYCLRIPEEYGSGYIKGYQFDFGVGVIDADFYLKREFILCTEGDLLHPLKIIFNREASIFHRFHNQKEYTEVRHLESTMLGSTVKNPNILLIPSEQPVCFFSLEINRKLFEEKIESFLSEMNPEMVELFRDVNGVNNFFYKNYYSLDIAGFIEEFIDCDLEGFMKSVYLEGKAYEILTYQLRQYLDDLREPNQRVILRKATIDSIKKAVTIIENEIERMDNIVNLAKRVGLNQNTLQQGFQYMYKTSVNEYIRNYRIEKAKELLENTGLNITEITYKVGINSRSYFSKLFKKKYGMAPKEYLNITRNKSKDSYSA